MKLTSHTDFALRVLISLAVTDEPYLSVDELAARHGVSRHHLQKVAQNLARLGYVTSGRGRAGGFRLARAPGDIRMGGVVRDMEGDAPFVECMGEGKAGEGKAGERRPGEAGQCVLAGACLLTRAFTRSLDAFYAELDRLSLADLAAPRRALRDRLGLAPRPASAPQPVAAAENEASEDGASRTERAAPSRSRAA